MQHDVETARYRVSTHNDPCMAPCRVYVACSLGAAAEGSFRYAQVVQEVVNTDDSDESRPVVSHS